MINSDPTRSTNTPAFSRLIQFAYFKFDAYCPRAIARTSREPVRKILVLELKTEESCHLWSFRPDSLLGDRPIHHVHETPLPKTLPDQALLPSTSPFAKKSLPCIYHYHQNLRQNRYQHTLSLVTKPPLSCSSLRMRLSDLTVLAYLRRHSCRRQSCHLVAPVVNGSVGLTYTDHNQGRVLARI